jgi:hypothetical protein
VVEAVPILRYPEKSSRLPFISSDLIGEGYHAAFSYGGEIDFANMRSCLVSGNFSRILSDDYYPKSEFGSQADFAVTLLHHMNMKTEDYILGKDLPDPSSQSFTFYSYKNGIGMLTDTAGFGPDFISDDLHFSCGRVDNTLISYAKTMQQFVFDNYLSLSDPVVPLR